MSKKNEQFEVLKGFVCIAVIGFIVYSCSREEDNAPEITKQPIVSTSSQSQVVPKKQPDYVSLAAMDVPDSILLKDKVEDIAKFSGSSGVSCSDYDDKDMKDACLQGRNRIFEYKTKYPKVLSLCNEHHGGTSFVGTCLMEWIEDKNWMSSNKLSAEQNLVIRGCLKKQGQNYQAVDTCFREMTN